MTQAWSAFIRRQGGQASRRPGKDGAVGSVAELMAKAVHIGPLEEENRRLRKIVGQQHAPSMDIIGHSSREVFGLVARVSDSNTTVLITGETGTGKELIAERFTTTLAQGDR